MKLGVEISCSLAFVFEEKSNKDIIIKLNKKAVFFHQLFTDN